MRSIEKAKEIAQLWRDLQKCEPHEMVNGKALYKADFVLFVIERMEAEIFHSLNETVQMAKDAALNAKDVF